MHNDKGGEGCVIHALPSLIFEGYIPHSLEWGQNMEF